MGPREALDGVREKAVREELRKVLASPLFRNSKRCREFLEYIVEHTTSDRDVRALKERSIGVAVFNLPPTYDTGEHAVVRVTATEVRKKLAQYYGEQGAHDELRIELLPGSYLPEFRDSREAAKAEEPRRSRAASRRFAVFAALGGGVVLAILSALVVLPRLAPSGTKPPVAARDVHPAPSGVAQGEGIRILVGSSQTYVDHNGRSWMADRYFDGGRPMAALGHRIFRTLDPDIYRNFRRGNFRYAIPLAPGAYELHLHFAETFSEGGLIELSQDSSGEATRRFNVFANGQSLLRGFDIVSDAAGAGVADEKIFRDISPGPDGFLRLDFVSGREQSVLSGIEILPASAGKIRPIRIAAGRNLPYQDPSGLSWEADRYFLGGNAIVRVKSPLIDQLGSSSGLYTSERWGHFSYAVPVPEGKFKLTLRFCEAHWGPSNPGRAGAGNRIFDVYCNGTTLLKNFDIFQAAGGEGRPVARTFSGLRPTPQGKLIITFVPSKDYASLNGLEVIEEAP